jgi:integrase/recombinase XerD
MVSAILHTLEQFRRYLHDVGYGKAVQHSLPTLVKEFIEHQGITDLCVIERQKIRAFYEYLPTRPLKNRSGALSEAVINHYAYALSTFFTWLEVTEQIDYNPISAVRFKRYQQRSRQPLSLEQINQLFEAASTLKETALLHVFYSCGLRRSEGEALNINDVRFKERLLYVRQGKGCKRRVVPLTEKVSRELESYYLQERTAPSVPQRRKYKDIDTEAFFISSRGNRLNGTGLHRLFKIIAQRALLPPLSDGQEASLHHLRHSIATHLLQSGMSMVYVRDFLGHSQLESTHIYAKPDVEQLRLL